MKLLHTLAAALAAGTLAAQASAQEYPAGDITIVVPYGAGGTTDTSARQLATMAEDALGANIVVENRPGGSGTNAMRSVAGAAPDGYTLIATTSSPSFVTPALRPVGYDPVADFDAIMNYSGPYHGVLVQDGSPYQSLQGLIDAAGSETVTYATAGAMGGAHLAFVAVARETGANLQHVPFDGAGAATSALLGGHVDVALVPAYRDLVEDGQLRLLGVLDGTEDPDFPDAPTLTEAGYDVEFPSIVAMMAPAGIDPEIRDRLQSTFTEVVQSQEFADFMSRINQPVRVMTGAEVEEVVSRNLESYHTLVEDMGLSQ